MAKCFIYSSSGSTGNGISVVVSANQPSPAKENVIWVESAIVSNEYIFSPAAPAITSEGLVWFTSTTKGICTETSIYSNSTWNRVNAYMYIEGAWANISTAATYLYNKGDLCSGESGGWTNTFWYGNKEFPGAVASMSNGSSSLSIGYGGQTGLIQTVSLIDFSDVKSLTAVIISSGSGNKLAVSTGNGAYSFPGNVKASKTFASAGTVELDVSSLTGSYYIGFGVGSNFVIESIYMSY